MPQLQDPAVVQLLAFPHEGEIKLSTYGSPILETVVIIEDPSDSSPSCSISEDWAGEVLTFQAPVAHADVVAAVGEDSFEPSRTIHVGTGLVHLTPWGSMHGEKVLVVCLGNVHLVDGVYVNT